MSETLSLLNNNNMIENQQKLVVNDEPKIRIYQQNIDMPTKIITIYTTSNIIIGEENDDAEESQQNYYNEMSLKSQATVADNNNNNNRNKQHHNETENYIQNPTTNMKYATLLLKVGDTTSNNLTTDINKSSELLTTVVPTTTTTTTTINIDDDNNDEKHDHHNDVHIHLNDVEYTSKDYAESINGKCNNKLDNDEKSNITSNGQTLAICMRDLNIQSQQQQTTQQLHHQRLEKVCCDEQEVSLITKADCISGAVNESVIEADSDKAYVVNIHIQQLEPESEKELQENQLENLKQLNSVHGKDQEAAHKKVSIVKLNDITENVYFDLIGAVHEKSDLQLGIDKMVHKTQIQNKNKQLVEVGAVTTGVGTSVTELNVNNPNYLYYMMSSGQFSPCETLDSGTGSDLESKDCTSVPKLELHLKTNKIRVNNIAKSLEHQRASSLTDSEESESSSLSCDSLHSAEFMNSALTQNVQKEVHSFSATLLPDSLLRDIRDRASLTDITDHTREESLNEQEYVEVQEKKTVQTSAKSSKRASMPNKTFTIDQESGHFEDTKMNSMPRKYEADKYYDFHVKEHENYHSFNINKNNDDDVSENEENSYKDCNYDHKSPRDESFAGFRDIRCTSATSTIRSSKGTVRGVKNRVRNGIATFLQLQHPNVKSFKDKDVGKVVLYTTSMGIIRDTSAKCQNLKQILRTNLIKFEERDVFMSLEYQQEIKERMQSSTIKVPQLFVEGQHIGDADTVERLNESGELRQLLKPYKSIATTFTCQTCGGYRLLPCPSCNGSKKSVHRNHFTAEFVALKCMNCDEVGLVKCHSC